MPDGKERQCRHVPPAERPSRLSCPLPRWPARLPRARWHFESEHPGYCGALDTFYVGNLKGVGRVYQQTFIDTYSKVACAKLYDRKTPITTADLLNDRVFRSSTARR